MYWDKNEEEEEQKKERSTSPPGKSPRVKLDVRSNIHSSKYRIDPQASFSQKNTMKKINQLNLQSIPGS